MIRKLEPATKEDLVAATTRLGLECDKKLDDLRGEMVLGFDKVNTTLDVIYKEVVAKRQHDLVINHQQDIQDSRLDKLEEVIKVESL